MTESQECWEDKPRECEKEGRSTSVPDFQLGHMKKPTWVLFIHSFILDQTGLLQLNTVWLADVIWQGRLSKPSAWPIKSCETSSNGCVFSCKVLYSQRYSSPGKKVTMLVHFQHCFAAEWQERERTVCTLYRIGGMRDAIRLDSNITLSFFW